MPTEQIGDYEIEYAGEHLNEVEGWAAFVTVYGPSTNPMHRNALVPHQRVAVEQVFAPEADLCRRALSPGGRREGGLRHCDQQSAKPDHLGRDDAHHGRPPVARCTPGVRDRRRSRAADVSPAAVAVSPSVRSQLTRLP